MTNVQDMNEQVAAIRKALESTREPPISTSMEPHDIHGRLARVEGGVATQQWAVGVVSAALLGAMAIVIAITLALWGSVSSLSSKVDALPGAIRQELQDMNGSMLEAIRTGRDTAQPTSPAVVIIPQAAQSASPATPAGPAGTTSGN